MKNEKSKSAKATQVKSANKSDKVEKESKLKSKE